MLAGSRCRRCLAYGAASRCSASAPQSERAPMHAGRRFPGSTGRESGEGDAQGEAPAHRYADTSTTKILDELEGSPLKYRIISETHETQEWFEGTPAELMDALRRAQEGLTKDDIVEKTAKSLSLQLEGIARLWMGQKGACDRLSTILGITPPKSEVRSDRGNFDWARRQRTGDYVTDVVRGWDVTLGKPGKKPPNFRQASDCLDLNQSEFHHHRVQSY